MSCKQHGEQDYQTRSTDAASWHQPHTEQSLALIRATDVAKSAAIIDVGGGAFELAHRATEAGHTQGGKVQQFAHCYCQVVGA